jgi:hypothetical protein
MSLFKCSKCGCIENTACCNYWSSKSEGKRPVCSECDPAIKKWHGRFEKRSAVGMLVDQEGHLWSKDQQAARSIPRHCRIVAEVVRPEDI